MAAFFITILISEVAIGKEKFLSIPQQEIGIPIYRNDFDLLVYKYTIILQKKSPLKINDCIAIVRLFNTVYYSELNKQVLYKKLIDALTPDYSNLIINELEAKEQKGLYFYSKKYDISFGGPSTNNNTFKIVDR